MIQPFSWLPDAHGFLVAAFHQAHGLGHADISHVSRSATSCREDPRERVPHRAFGVAEVGRVDEGEAEAVLPLGAVAVQVAYRVAEGVAQAGELPADRFWHDDDLVAVVPGPLHEIARVRQLERGEEDDLAAGVELLAGVQADVEPLGFVMLRALLEVLQVGDQGVDHFVLVAGQQD